MKRNPQRQRVQEAHRGNEIISGGWDLEHMQRIKAEEDSGKQEGLIDTDR